MEWNLEPGRIWGQWFPVLGGPFRKFPTWSWNLNWASKAENGGKPKSELRRGRETREGTPVNPLGKGLQAGSNSQVFKN